MGAAQFLESGPPTLRYMIIGVLDGMRPAAMKREATDTMSAQMYVMFIEIACPQLDKHSGITFISVSSILVIWRLGKGTYHFGH